VKIVMRSLDFAFRTLWSHPPERLTRNSRTKDYSHRYMMHSDKIMPAERPRACREHLYCDFIILIEVCLLLTRAGLGSPHPDKPSWLVWVE
jgi:hypothetical protein